VKIVSLFLRLFSLQAVLLLCIASINFNTVSCSCNKFVEHCDMFWADTKSFCISPGQWSDTCHRGCTGTLRSDGTSQHFDLFWNML